MAKKDELPDNPQTMEANAHKWGLTVEEWKE